MQRYILSIDQGTTGTTALLFDESLAIRATHTVNFPQHFPHPSWVEHDLNQIWDSVLSAVRHVMEKAGGGKVEAIGISNQRETTCLWKRDAAGTPIAKAIVWQDRRTADFCEKLKRAGEEKWITKKTGLLLDPYFSGTKLAWLLKNVDGAMALAKQGNLAFGTIESFLLYRMSGQHHTEPSNACRTLLMDLKRCDWDDDLLKVFKIPRSVLPTILPSCVEYGKTKGFAGLPDGIPITGLAGDQQAALFGQACFDKGNVKCTYGTGAFILTNVGTTPVYSKHRLLSSVGWKIKGKTTYVLEGSAFIAGAAVQWIRDGLNLISTSSEVEALAASVPDSDGVTFVPALSGMGAPHWLAHASGLITGISRRTTKAHVARATLDGVAFQVRELLEAMTKDLGKKLNPIKVDGGASANDLLMQFQSDLVGVDVVRAAIMETTALGAGLQAGLGVGFWKDLDDIRGKWKAAKTFAPKMAAKDRKTQIERWDKAMRAVTLLAQD